MCGRNVLQNIDLHFVRDKGSLATLSTNSRLIPEINWEMSKVAHVSPFPHTLPQLLHQQRERETFQRISLQVSSFFVGSKTAAEYGNEVQLERRTRKERGSQSVFGRRIARDRRRRRRPIYRMSLASQRDRWRGWRTVAGFPNIKQCSVIPSLIMTL